MSEPGAPITIFSIPKPFAGHIGDIQHNALESWKRLHPEVHIILYGDDAGVAEAAAEHGVQHVAQINRSLQGTPMLDDAFMRTQGNARHPVVCYSNADIILLPDLLRAVESMGLWRYLLVGCRTDLDLTGRLSFEGDWQGELRARAERDGTLHNPSGLDYFVFPKGQLRGMPPFPVGRPRWDNWMVYHHRLIGVPVIDLTADVLAVHQNHDYSHMAGGKKEVWAGSEAQRSAQLLGPHFVSMNIADASFEYHDGKVMSRRGLRYTLRTFWLRGSRVPILRVLLLAGRRCASAMRKKS